MVLATVLAAIPIFQVQIMDASVPLAVFIPVVCGPGSMWLCYRAQKNSAAEHIPTMVPVSAGILRVRIVLDPRRNLGSE